MFSLMTLVPPSKKIELRGSFNFLTAYLACHKSQNALEQNSGTAPRAMYCELQACNLTNGVNISKILLLWPDVNSKRLWDFKNISRRCQISFLMLRSRKMKVLEMKKVKIKFSKKSPFWAPNSAWLYILVRSLREQSLKKIVFSVRKNFFVV